MIGQMLLHYQILDTLGQGGMGEVYKAHDTRLNRPVAIKVLKPSESSGREPQKRLLNEAQAASALNHPNIVTIHEIGTAMGLDFIVMEFVEGQPLSRLIGTHGLAFKDALRYAIQIADALGKAHSAGIVHRDLKPANVMITNEGKAKLLDFGIAKRLESLDAGEAAPTRELGQDQLTSGGTTAGTVAYMSPEQLVGGKVDARSDIFSFAVVLYEMMTGRRPFGSGPSAVTVTAILRDQPRLDSEYVGRFPPDVARILDRGLRKEPSRRFQHIDDLRVELEDLLEKPEAAASADHAGVRSKRRPWLSVVIAVAGVLAGVGLGWLLWRSFDRAKGHGPILSRVTPDLDFATEPAPSPDGKLVVYGADPENEGRLNLWVRQLAGGPAVRVTRDPFDNHDPAFSPDGTRIAFRSERDNGGIYVVPALGGDPLLIAKNGNRPRFSPDGRWIVFWQTIPGSTWGKVFVVPSSGGAPRFLSDRFVDAHYPIWSPDSDSVLFCGTPAEQPPGKDYHDWHVVSLKDGAITRTGAFDILNAAGINPTRSDPGHWSADGVVFPGRTADTEDLWILPLRGNQAGGAPQRLTTGAGRYSDPLFAGSGRIVFTSGSNIERVWSLPADGNTGKVSGQAELLTPGVAWKSAPSVSADGKRVVFASAGTGSDSDDILILDTTARKPRALTSTPMREYFPVITRDGERVAYRINEGNREGRPVYAISSSGGAPEMICENGDRPTGWSPDGRSLLLMTGAPKIVNLVDVASHQIRKFLGEPDWDFRHAKFAPDGRWVAFLASHGGVTRPYVVPYREGGAPQQAAWIAVAEPRVMESDIEWSPDGRLVYYATRENGKVNLWARRFQPVAGTFSEAPFLVYAFTDVRNVPPRSFPIAVARDKIVFTLETLTSEVWLLTPEPGV